MMKISRKASVILSFVLTGLTGILIIVSVLLVLFRYSSSVKDALFLVCGTDTLSASVYTVIAVLLSILFAAGETAIVFLFLLLANIQKGLIFTDKNVLFLRILSWLCIGASVMFAVIGIVAFPYMIFRAFPAGFAALFFGVILRVIKNAFEEAAALKNENDLTI